MNVALTAANILLLLAFLIHTFMGDREFKIIAPTGDVDEHNLKREKWTMARSGWHWVSTDLLFAALLSSIVNFSDVIVQKQFILYILSLYFFVYGSVWLLIITISPKFPGNYFKLVQWLLLWIISGLLYWGTFYL